MLWLEFSEARHAGASRCSEASPSRHPQPPIHTTERALGYVPKDHIADIAQLTEVTHRVAKDRSVVDAPVASPLVTRPRYSSPLACLIGPKQEV
jgi:hypothetical protein